MLACAGMAAAATLLMAGTAFGQSGAAPRMALNIALTGTASGSTNAAGSPAKS
jgi:hypothetical protein